MGLLARSVAQNWLRFYRDESVGQKAENIMTGGAGERPIAEGRRSREVAFGVK